jgi:integrase/recombinase XerC
VLAVTPPPSPLQAPGPELQAFLTYLRVERRLAERTLAMYGEALSRLEASAGASGVDLPLAGPQHLRQWVGQLRTRGLAPRSIAIALAAWRGLYAWWGRQGRVQTNPVQGLRAPKAAKPLPTACSTAQGAVGGTGRGPGRPARHTRPPGPGGA